MSKRPFVFLVEGEVRAVDGGGDGAYELCDCFTVDELLAVLRQTLQQRVKQMLTAGKTPVGHVLRVEIRDERDWEHIR